MDAASTALQPFVVAQHLSHLLPIKKLFTDSNGVELTHKSLGWIVEWKTYSNR